MKYKKNIWMQCTEFYYMYFYNAGMQLQLLKIWKLFIFK